MFRKDSFNTPSVTAWRNLTNTFVSAQITSIAISAACCLAIKANTGIIKVWNTIKWNHTNDIGSGEQKSPPSSIFRIRLIVRKLPNAWLLQRFNWQTLLLILIILSLSRVITFKIPLQPHKTYNVTQYEELGFPYNQPGCSDERWLCTTNSHYLMYTLFEKHQVSLPSGAAGSSCWVIPFQYAPTFLNSAPWCSQEIHKSRGGVLNHFTDRGCTCKEENKVETGNMFFTTPPPESCVFHSYCRNFHSVSQLNLIITPKSDQCQISPAASAEIFHHTVWRTWLFIA